MTEITEIPLLHSGDVIHVEWLGVDVIVGGYEITGRGYARLYGWELPQHCPVCIGDTRTLKLAGLNG